LARKRPALKEAVDETSVEDIAGAGGIPRLDSKGGGVVKLRAVPTKDAFFAQSGGGEDATEALANGRERFTQVIFGSEAARNISAGDEVVDVLQKRFTPGIEVVEIGNDGNACGARPACGGCCGDSVMAVQVKRARVDNPIALKFFGAQGEAIVAFPEDRALAGVINEDESLLARAARGGNEVRFDAAAKKFFAMQRSGTIVTDLADVSSAQSPLLASNDRRGDLPAGENVGGTKFDLGAAGREVVKRKKRISGIEAYADEVDFG